MKLVKGYHKHNTTFAYYDDVLPFDLYERLLATFPSFSEMHHVRTGKYHWSNKKGNAGATQIMKLCKKNPAWQEVYEWAVDGEYVRLLREYYSPQILKTYTVRFEISSIIPGGSVPPHTDVLRKIVAGVLYFPPLNWPIFTSQGAANGALEGLRYIDPEMKSDPYKQYDWTEVHTIIRAGYKANRLAVLTRNDNFLHGVRPTHGVLPRQSLTLTLLRLHEDKGIHARE